MGNVSPTDPQDDEPVISPLGPGSSEWRRVMQPLAVKVQVSVSVPFECLFWPEDDSWRGNCAELSLTVRGSNFEEAKKHMEAALDTYIELVRPRIGQNGMPNASNCNKQHAASS